MITGYFGIPGVGKTTLASAYAQKELKKIKKNKSRYKHILTNFYCEGCEKVDFSQLGINEYSDALIILDEITIDADNRDFKNFKKSSINFFIYHRHYNIDIVYFTQQYDAVDKKIKHLTQYLYMMQRSYLFPFCKFKRIFRIVDIDELTHDIVLGYRFANFKECLIALFFPRKIGKITGRIYMPKWYKYFNSFCRPLKLENNFTYETWVKSDK